MLTSCFSFYEIFLLLVFINGLIVYSFMNICLFSLIEITLIDDFRICGSTPQDFIAVITLCVARFAFD